VPRKPRIYCDACGEKTTGLEKRALAAVKNAWKGNVARRDNRSVLCKCGERFTTDRRKVQRCPSCERRHG
jgi:hypothetical protein